MGQDRLGPSYFFISLVLALLNSLVWYVPSLRYTHDLGLRMHCGVEATESNTNKQHHLSKMLRPRRMWGLKLEDVGVHELASLLTTYPSASRTRGKKR